MSGIVVKYKPGDTIVIKKPSDVLYTPIYGDSTSDGNAKWSREMDQFIGDECVLVLFVPSNGWRINGYSWLEDWMVLVGNSSDKAYNHAMGVVKQ